MNFQNELCFDIKINGLVFLFFVLTFSENVIALNLKEKRQAQEVMVYQCGACHVPNKPTTHQAALKIFNLQDTNWTRGLSESRKNEVVRRIRERIDISDLDLSYLMPRGFRPLPVRPSPREVDLVEKYLKEATKPLEF